MKSIRLQIQELSKKANECARKRDFINELKYRKQIQELSGFGCERMTMDEALTKEQQIEMCTLLVKGLVYADLCYAIIIALKSLANKYGLLSVDLFDQMTTTVNKFSKIINTIDLPGDIKLSEHYADMVEEVEDKCNYWIENIIWTVINKRIKFE